MAESWKEKALEIGKSLQEAAKVQPELAPLYTSWMNFARKHGLLVKADGCQDLHALLQRHGLTIIPAHKVASYEKTINSQAEEIKALEYHIATLLRPEQ